MVKEFTNALTGQTFIPITLAITLFGGVFWLSTMWANGEKNTKDIHEIKAEIKELQVGQATLDRSLVRFEQILERVDKRTERLELHITP